MPRALQFLLLWTFTAVSWLMLAGAAAAQPPSNPPHRNPLIHFASVTPSENGLELRIAMDQPVTPIVTTLSHPDRLVFDFPGFVFQGAPRTEINRGVVVRIRTSLFQVNPPMARIVIDLRQPADYHVQSEGKLTTIAVPGKRQELQAPVVKTPTAKPVSPPPARATRAAPAASVPAVPNATAAPPKPRSSPVDTAPAANSRQPVPIPTWEPSPDSHLQVRYRNGMLTVAASNITLNEILLEIGVKMGVVIEMPSMPERVLTTRGPGPPREVIAGLLEGMPYDFELPESETGRYLKIVIIPRAQ